MLKMFTATIRNGALVLPDGADLGLSEEGDEVQVAVEVADAFDRAGLLFAASRPSQFERMGGAVTYPEREELQPPPLRTDPWPDDEPAHFRSPRSGPTGNTDEMRIGPRTEPHAGNERRQNR